MRHPVQEVRCAIQRVNDPTAGWIFAECFFGFFTKKTVVRACFCQLLTNGFFGCSVRFGHKIARPLGGNLKVLHFLKIAQQFATGDAGRFDHDVHIGRGVIHVFGFQEVRQAPPDKMRSGAFYIFHSFGRNHNCFTFTNEWRDHDAYAVIQDGRLKAVSGSLAFHSRLCFCDRTSDTLG